MELKKEIQYHRTEQKQWNGINKVQNLEMLMEYVIIEWSSIRMLIVTLQKLNEMESKSSRIWQWQINVSVLIWSWRWILDIIKLHRSLKRFQKADKTSKCECNLLWWKKSYRKRFTNTSQIKSTAIIS
jgi:hypothetical protein